MCVEVHKESEWRATTTKEIKLSVQFLHLVNTGTINDDYDATKDTIIINTKTQAIVHFFLQLLYIWQVLCALPRLNRKI